MTSMADANTLRLIFLEGSVDPDLVDPLRDRRLFGRWDLDRSLLDRSRFGDVRVFEVDSL